MTIIMQISFWILIGLLYLGVHFQYQEILIGLCAVGLGLVETVNFFRQRRTV